LHTIGTDGTAHALHEARAHGETEAGALPRLLRRHERLEDLLQQFARDARSVVRDDDLDDPPGDGDGVVTPGAEGANETAPVRVVHARRVVLASRRHVLRRVERARLRAQHEARLRLPLRQGIRRVYDQVHEYLLKLVRVRGDGGDVVLQVDDQLEVAVEAAL